jgi:flagellar biosynthesis protein FlhG
MDEEAGSGSPKTLADVSHLFFSSVEEAADESSCGSARGEPEERGHAAASADVAVQTRVLVVTGGRGSPGKSTVAVNLAQALATFGRVALFDADASVPNARYFLGVPSWNYLTPLTGEGEEATSIVTDSGVLITDWTADGSWQAEDGQRDSVSDEVAIYAELPDTGRAPLDFAVVDVPPSRSELLAWLGSRVTEFVVVARPGRRSFEETYVALRAVRAASRAESAQLVVNGASGDREARDFHAKTAEAARRLLSMEVRYLGAVPAEKGLGAAQRERGPVVASRPHSAAALALRGMVTQLVDTETRRTQLREQGDVGS